MSVEALVSNQELKDKINEARLLKYVAEAEDIRRCPRKGCSYAGFISLDLECREPLRCHACKHEWRDPVHFTSLEKLKI